MSHEPSLPDSSRHSEWFSAVSFKSWQRGSPDVWNLNSVMHSSYAAVQLDFPQSAMPPWKTVTGYYGRGRAAHIQLPSNIFLLQAVSALNGKIGPWLHPLTGFTVSQLSHFKCCGQNNSFLTSPQGSKHIMVISLCASLSSHNTVCSL